MSCICDERLTQFNECAICKRKHEKHIDIVGRTIRCPQHYHTISLGTITTCFICERCLNSGWRRIADSAAGTPRLKNVNTGRIYDTEIAQIRLIRHN